MKLKYFEKAKQAALRSNYKYKVGACLVIGNEVYTGWNRVDKTHPKSMTDFNKIHAEFDVLYKAGFYNEKLSSAEIYIYRITKKGNPALSKPCPGCINLLRKYKINRIYFTDIDGYYIYKLKDI